MTAAAQVGGRQAAVAFIFITIVLATLALGIIIPVLPHLIESFMGGDTAGAAKIYGVFGTVWALMQFFAMPVMGALSDRYGRRRVILLSNLGLGLDYVLMALAPNLAWLFVGRVISGITAASFSTAMAYIADVTPPEKRAASFGKVGVASGSASCSDPRSAGCSAASIRACRSGPLPASAWPTRCTGCSCCRSRCRRRSAGRSSGAARIRSAR